MGIQIYGIQMFSSVVNWFTSIYAFLLLLVITLAGGYAFYKLNFTTHKYETNAGNHYFFNALLFGAYGLMLFWVGRYVLKMDLVMSVIFTGIFYAASIFILTLILIFMRRNKLKNFVIKSAKWINEHPEVEWKWKNILDMIRDKCIAGDHHYTDMLLADIDAEKPADKTIKNSEGKYLRTEYPEDKVWKGKGKRPIDIAKYESINIWENKNMDSEIDRDTEKYY